MRLSGRHRIKTLHKPHSSRGKYPASKLPWKSCAKQSARTWICLCLDSGPDNFSAVWGTMVSGSVRVLWSICTGERRVVVSPYTWQLFFDNRNGVSSSFSSTPISWGFCWWPELTSKTLDSEKTKWLQCSSACSDKILCIWRPTLTARQIARDSKEQDDSMWKSTIFWSDFKKKLSQPVA